MRETKLDTKSQNPFSFTPLQEKQNERTVNTSGCVKSDTLLCPVSFDTSTTGAGGSTNGEGTRTGGGGAAAAAGAGAGTVANTGVGATTGGARVGREEDDEDCLSTLALSLSFFKAGVTDGAAAAAAAAAACAVAAAASCACAAAAAAAAAALFLVAAAPSSAILACSAAAAWASRSSREKNLR